MPLNLPEEKQFEMSSTHKSKVLEETKRLFERVGYQLLTDIDIFSTAICIIDKKGNYIKVNRSFCCLSGFKPEQLLGNPLSLRVSEADKNVQTGESFPHTGRGSLLQKEGLELQVMYHTALLTDSLEKGCQLIFMEAAEEKTPEMLIKPEDEESVMAISVQEAAEDMLFHDMRKPIANIVSICNLLLSSGFDITKMVLWVEILIAEATKSIQLLDARQGFKKMEMNSYVLEKEYFDIINLLRLNIRPLEPSLQKRDLAIKLFINGRSCKEQEQLMVRADRFFIEIMLNNLLTNALEASPDRQIVKINLYNKNKTDLRLDIYNKGVIPEPVRETFFEKFSTYGKAKGLGLGTYTARLIAEAHQGVITFSTSDEKGTRLQVFLPQIIDQNKLQPTGTE